ncbi:N-acetylglucosamine-6-phosphate deacetylase [Neobacillus rhizophilus]|uniref:N-acetylglucosamine-6-phosphate deacetylase n=1 Tax=Neobacillus rhizophilus TaxID=2833579 RepID=A0A942YTM8_9BACI|nr:N-acetylglucosamine-6-phosphate deacetylase [Neobacillus rhizophilus]MBS4212339.1 N-acetylglucosamine-6-phosphate deacetylase [Neobacillus rhizophilus]
MNPIDNLILIKDIKIYTEDRIIEKGYIKIENNHIIEVGRLEDLSNEGNFEIIEVPSNYIAVPGFIDVHIHGVNGADTMDATKEALDNMASSLPGEGTTSFLATTMTHEPEQIEKAVINAGDYISNQPDKGQAEILGIHLEGPFVNASRAGAQPAQYIIDPNLSLLKEWQERSNGMIKLVTLAPERPGGLEMVRYLRENGIIASIGHSDATFEEVGEAVKAGANHVTHLFNQMRGLHHREPGIVGAAFLHDELKAEMIVDGVHVHPEMVKLAFKQKQSEGIILITDSMRAKCLKNGHYDLGGQEVTVKDGKATLADGTLAGSILKLGHAVKNVLSFTGCTLEEAVQMVSVNPAKQLNIYDKKGSIAAGKDADIVILDHNMEIFMTLCRGAVAFKKEAEKE